MTLERVAERYGYDPVSAFSRSFKRHIGNPPGSYRRQMSGIEHPVIPIQQA